MLVPAGAFDKSAWCCAGMFTITQDLSAIDEHMKNTGSKLVWVFEGGLVNHGFRIEYDDICVVACCQFAAPVELQISGGQAGHAVDGIFECDDLFFTDVFPKQARKRAIGAWVWL